MLASTSPAHVRSDGIASSLQGWLACSYVNNYSAATEAVRLATAPCVNPPQPVQSRSCLSCLAAQLTKARKNAELERWLAAVRPTHLRRDCATSAPGLVPHSSAAAAKTSGRRG